jgi:hypothetical protein
LLIAGMFSFFNAGSGTNQSNHMYKLGPVHQGVTERGCKTASDSYILWPARIGAFSVVVGNHYDRPDTSDLPFSYLIEHNGESVLVPGTNLRKVGLVRDAGKWPKRDRRKDRQRLDLINFELLGPYVIQKILRGSELLAAHKSGPKAKADCFSCPGVKIENVSVDNGLRYYGLAVDKFIGDCVIGRLENKQFETMDQLRAALEPETKGATGRWVDLAGLFAPEEVVQKMLADIDSGAVATLEQVTQAFKSMYDNSRAYEWSWASNLLQQRSGKGIEELTAEEVIELVTRWKKAADKLGRYHLADAQKEYTGAVQTGYGLDGDEETKAADFEAVRGTFEENSFVCEIEESISRNAGRFDRLIGRLEKLR